VKAEFVEHISGIPRLKIIAETSEERIGLNVLVRSRSFQKRSRSLMITDIEDTENLSLTIGYIRYLSGTYLKYKGYSNRITAPGDEPIFGGIFNVNQISNDFGVQSLSPGATIRPHCSFAMILIGDGTLNLYYWLNDVKKFHKYGCIHTRDEYEEAYRKLKTDNKLIAISAMEL